MQQPNNSPIARKYKAWINEGRSSHLALMGPHSSGVWPCLTLGCQEVLSAFTLGKFDRNDECFNEPHPPPSMRRNSVSLGLYLIRWLYRIFPEPTASKQRDEWGLLATLCHPYQTLGPVWVIHPRTVTVVLNLWVMTPWSSYVRDPAYQIFSLQFITVATLQLWSSDKIILWLGGHHNMRGIHDMRNYIKGLQH